MEYSNIHDDCSMIVFVHPSAFRAENFRYLLKSVAGDRFGTGSLTNPMPICVLLLYVIRTVAWWRHWIYMSIAYFSQTDTWQAIRVFEVTSSPTSLWQRIARVELVHLMTVGSSQMTANLRLVSLPAGWYCLHPPPPFSYSAKSWYPFYHPTWSRST